MTMTYTPRSITLTEADPLSVASYKMTARFNGGPNDGQVAAGPQIYTTSGSGTDTVNIGATPGFFTPTLIGKQVKLFVQQVGPDGTTTAESVCRDVDGHEVFTVNELPNGPEGAVVTP
jgi:hypothetical protein